MHDLCPNNCATLASSVEKTYLFPETPTPTVSLETTAAGTNMAQTHTFHNDLRQLEPGTAIRVSRQIRVTSPLPAATPVASGGLGTNDSAM